MTEPDDTPEGAPPPNLTRTLCAAVMNVGTLEECEGLRQRLGDDAFRYALQHAKPGEFSVRSWHYWHLVLGLAAIGEVPPLPTERVEP